LKAYVSIPIEYVSIPIQSTDRNANSPTLAVAVSRLDTYQMYAYVQFELLMMGGKTARNM
jgi:hypothetical protein